MYYYYYKRRYPEDVLVYIEEFNRSQKTVVFDFIDSGEHATFARYANTEYSDFKPSMVVLKNYTLRNIRENTIYAINQETISEWRTQGFLNQENINSFIIGYNIELPNSETEIFRSSISFNDFTDIGLNYYIFGDGRIDKLPISLKGKLSLTVRNVGQGNWNEINSNGDVKFVYDAGAPMLASRAAVRNLIGDRPVLYSNSKPGLFLSHWDKDHYHSLVGMTDAELSNFSFFVCRNIVPNITSRILFQRIATSIGLENIFPLFPEQRYERGGPTYLFPITPIQDQLTIYNAQQHKDRNISGIVLSVRTANSSAVLTGDSHYEQISRDVLPHFRYPHTHNLVVPHHGGKAGDYIYELSDNIAKGDAIISVGQNYYGHPIHDYLAYLNADQFNVMQTQLENGDITIYL